MCEVQFLSSDFPYEFSETIFFVVFWSSDFSYEFTGTKFLKHQLFLFAILFVVKNNCCFGKIVLAQHRLEFREG